MFGIGLPELILLLIIAFVVMGPEKLPQIARTLGKGLFELRRATDELRGELEKEGNAIQKSVEEGETPPASEREKGGEKKG